MPLGQRLSNALHGSLVYTGRAGHGDAQDPLDLAGSCIYYRSPLLLARLAADIDRVSNGRLVLGLGIGDDTQELRNFRFPSARRGNGSKRWRKRCGSYRDCGMRRRSATRAHISR